MLIATEADAIALTLRPKVAALAARLGGELSYWETATVISHVSSSMPCVTGHVRLEDADKADALLACLSELDEVVDIRRANLFFDEHDRFFVSFTIPLL